ncbi:MAG: histidine kinase [Bacteroidales bacterium]|nr:histidine kinase [Bacteroidales bacterium]
MKDSKKKFLNKEFVTKLPSYSPLSMLIRFAVVSLAGILAIRFIMLVVDPLPELDEMRPRLKDYLFIIFAFNLLGEANIIFDMILEKFLPIPEKIKLRLATHSFAGITLIVAVFQLTKLLFPEYEQVGKAPFLLAVAMGLIFVNMMTTSLILIRFMDKWVYAQKRIDAMKEEKLRMDYTVLQDQINPHFLFNNLSVLKSLIIYDQETAVSFTQNFTDVYRYVLKSKDKVLVEFKDELQFIDSYIALHKERLGNGIDVQFMIDKEGIEKNIAPLSLQLLVENAIKHNIVSKENPLLLEISSDNNYVIVKNNLQLKESSYSTKTGLSNLVKRYELLESEDVIVEQGDDYFMVKVPLL